MMRTPVPPPPFTGDSTVSRWLNLLWKRVDAVGQILWSTVQFDGSDLTDLETRNHNDLQNIQGGETGEYYHLTKVERERALAAYPFSFPEDPDEPLFLPGVVSTPAPGSSGSGNEWGLITGTLSAQTDLQAALNLKAENSQIGAYFTFNESEGNDFPVVPQQAEAAAGTPSSLDKWVLIFAAAHG